jgi:hypothetical protein
MASVHQHLLQFGKNDVFMGYGSLVQLLVGLHIAAFLFWILTLAFSRGSKTVDKGNHQD